MAPSVFSRNALLRERLAALVGNIPIPLSPADPEDEIRVVAATATSADTSEPIDVVVSINEINDRHGTGPLVKRLFKGRRNILCIRSRDDWGVHDLGEWNVKISQRGRDHAECFQRVIRALAGRSVRTVLCVPFLVDELLTSIAVTELFNARLCVYVMDDQNIAAGGIPDDLMREFLEKCSLRLATHPELRVAYEQKYQMPFYVLPAVVPARFVLKEPLEPAYNPNSRAGALLGSFWDQSWFERLCSALEPTPYAIHWYGNNRSPWLTYPDGELARAHITAHGVVPEEELAAELRRYPFVIVPVGTLDGGELNKGVASLSLPGRILFAAAASQTPVLVVGSDQTCASNFVKHFGIGLTAPYEPAALAGAIERLCAPAVQQEMRRNAAALGRLISDHGVVDWLQQSIERGTPADMRFENAFAGYVINSSAIATQTAAVA